MSGESGGRYGGAGVAGEDGGAGRVSGGGSPGAEQAGSASAEAGSAASGGICGSADCGSGGAIGRTPEGTGGITGGTTEATGGDTTGTTGGTSGTTGGTIGTTSSTGGDGNGSGGTTSGTGGTTSSTGGDGNGTGGTTGGTGGTTGGTGGTTGGTGGDDVSWSPGSLSGLMLWLDAAVGVSSADGAVLTWRDQSAAHHLAASDSGFDGPRLDTTAFAGLPAVTFDGINDRLLVQDKESLRVRVADFALAVVVKSAPGPDGGDGRIIFSKQVPSPWPFQGIGVFFNGHVFVSYVQQLPAEVLYSTVGTVDDNRVRVFALHRHGNALSQRVNGALLETLSVGIDASAEGYPVRVGGGDDGQFLHGAIAEIVLSHVDSTADVERLEQYLLAKYAGVLATP